MERHKTYFPRSGDTGERVAATPGRIPLPIKSGERTKQEKLPIQDGIPWGKYKKFCRTYQAGTAELAYAYGNCTTVAVKERKFSNRKVEFSLHKLKSPNVVDLMEGFSDGTTFFFIYESMDAALSEIVGIHKLGANETVHVCKEVLKGLLYIHGALGIEHGKLDTDTILVSRREEIKIANIVDSMMDETRRDLNDTRDAKAVGLVMMHLMEPGTSLLRPDTVNVQHPERWTGSMRDFLGATQTDLLESLQARADAMSREHSYARGSLIPSVRMAECYKSQEVFYL